jgi:predicted transcriptional regulator
MWVTEQQGEKPMSVGRWMSRFPVILGPHVPCREALGIAVENAVHFMLVVDGDRLLGVARACDLRKVEDGNTVRRSLRAPVVTIGEDDSLELARRLLTVTGGGCLVVVNAAGNLTGILSCEDLNRAAAPPRHRPNQRCASCGAGQHLIFLQPDEPVFCCSCIDHARLGGHPLHTPP